MLSIVASSASGTLGSTQKRFKKFGQKMKKQTDITNIQEKMREVAREEQRRSRQIFDDHKKFFQTEKSKSKPKTKKSKAVETIDVFEK
jgi:hypothetical protein|tara:strand:- start:7323 stop:7586 length:264 start_codon:yes stop_codon:yes gene_type:complete